MIIKNIEQFESINEGVLKSIFSGIGDLFTSKKTKLEGILKGINKAKKEDLDHYINIEKAINNIPKDNSPEYRFDINNLDRQSRIFSSIKNQEISALIKEAKNIIKENPKLQAFFSSQLAKMEASFTEEKIKNLKKYKDSAYMDSLNKEFDELVKDANRKTEFYDAYQEKPTYSEEDILNATNKDLREFIDMSNTESYNMLRSYDPDKLKNLFDELKSLYFSLEMEWNQLYDPIKKDIRKAEKEKDVWKLDILKKQEMELRFNIKKPMDKVRYKLSLVDKEIRSRKYANY
jgi:hypothetical protein